MIILHRRQHWSSDVHLKLVVICNVLLFFLCLLFEILQFPHIVCSGYRHPGDLGQTTWGGPGQRGVSTIQQKLPVINDSGTSWRGGEEGPPGCLAVTVGQLGPVIQGEHPGGYGAAFGFIRAGRHASFCVAAAGGVGLASLKVLEPAIYRSLTASAQRQTDFKVVGSLQQLTE